MKCTYLRKSSKCIAYLIYKVSNAYIATSYKLIFCTEIYSTFPSLL